MNGKQSKQLRKEAKQAAINADLPELGYELKWYNKYYSDPLTGTLKGYKVYTAMMEPCERAIYQAMKRNFKRSA